MPEPPKKYKNITANIKNNKNNKNNKKVKKRKVRSSREEQCRDIFEHLFEKPFPTKRPSFLKNPETGRNLELDGYNAELNLAFEYDGESHHNFPNTWHRTEEDFKKQVNRDRFKDHRCYELGITLIRIPYTVAKDGLATFIIQELEAKGFEKI